MVAPGFGFSVGDFIAGIKLAIVLFDSFKASGGASSKFASEAAFLTSLESTVLRLSHHIQNTPPDDIAEGILGLLNVITGPLGDFKALLDKHHDALGKLPTASAVAKAKLTIGFTVKEISGKVEKLRKQIGQPLQAINSLLALQVLKRLEDASKEPLRKEQVEQIVQAIYLSDIPSELQKQSDALQRSASLHESQHDAQLQLITDVREDLLSHIEKLHGTVNGLKAEGAIDERIVTESPHHTMRAESASQERMTQSQTKPLEEALEEQTCLLAAFKSSLEEMASEQRRTHLRSDESSQQESAYLPWPTTILMTAQIATTLLSVVTSSRAVIPVAGKAEESETSRFVQPTVFRPNRHYSKSTAIAMNHSLSQPLGTNATMAWHEDRLGSEKDSASTHLEWATEFLQWSPDNPGSKISSRLSAGQDWDPATSDLPKSALAHSRLSDLDDVQADGSWSYAWKHHTVVCECKRGFTGKFARANLARHRRSGHCKNQFIY